MKKKKIGKGMMQRKEVSAGTSFLNLSELSTRWGREGGGALSPGGTFYTLNVYITAITDVQRILNYVRMAFIIRTRGPACSFFDTYLDLPAVLQTI